MIKILYRWGIGLREELEFLSVKGLLALAKVMPRPVIYGLTKGLSRTLYFMDKKRRLLTIKNLALAFPEKNEEEIIRLSREVYDELSKTVAEILLMFTDRLDIDAMVHNSAEAARQLEKIKADAPHGIIVMTAHFSNWELAAHFLAKHGLPMLAIGREGNNKLIDRRITVPFRNKYGNRATSKDNAMLAMVKTLKQGGNVGLLIDQKSGHLNSAKVDFFGRPAETTLSIAMLKQKLDPLVVPIFIAREQDGKYRMIIEEPITYTAEEIEGKEHKLKAMTQKYSDAIEKVIRAYPSQWFWMHNRWRHV